jgi:hypothetical protein
MEKIKVMVTFELTEDYIIEVESETEAIKKVQKIFDFKQESQNDLLKQYDIDYTVDIEKKYINVEEDEVVEEPQLDYEIIYTETAGSPDEALEKLQNRIVGADDYIQPVVSPVLNEEYEILTGIKAEGTQ